MKKYLGSWTKIQHLIDTPKGLESGWWVWV